MSRRLYVFGSNGECQLGIPAADIVSTPTRVLDPPPLEGLKAIRCGDNHTLFQANDGTIYGVGDNRKGQLALEIKEISQLDRFKNLEKGGSFIAATCESSAYVSVESAAVQSRVWTEGSGQWGELGRGDDITSTAEHNYEPVPTLPGTVVHFTAGVWHYVAILDDDSVYGWGKARLGQLGNTLSGKVTVPTKIEDIPFKPVKSICGKDFTYLIGDPSTGEHMLLGKDKFNIVSGKPQDVKGWKDIGATWHAIFVLFNDGKLTAWGKSNMWKLIPTGLPLLEKIAVGSDHVLAVTKDGRLISWGWGKHGNCGDLSNIEHNIKNDMFSGIWNNIDLPGEVEAIGAGFCTSFVIMSHETDKTAHNTLP